MGLFSWACRITRLVGSLVSVFSIGSWWFCVYVLLMMILLFVEVGVAVLGFDRGMGGTELGRVHQWRCWSGNQWDCAVSDV